MDNLKKTEIFQLILNGAQQRIIELCHVLLQKSPNDLEALYCKAVSCLLSGNFDQGVATLVSLLYTYRIQSLTSAQSIDTLSLVAHTARQLAGFIDFAETPEHKQYFELAVSVGREINQTLQDERIDAFVSKSKKRMMYTEEGFLFIRPESPRTLQIEPTNKCNLQCCMCPRKHMQRPTGFMQPDTMRKALESWAGNTVFFREAHLLFPKLVWEIRRTGGRVKLYFMGEPLLHPHFDTLAIIGREHGCRVEIQTNGSMLHIPEIRRRLLETRLTGISISLDGFDSNTFNTIRKGASYQRVLKGLKALHAERALAKLENAIQINLSFILADENTVSNRQKTDHLLAPFVPLANAIKCIPLDRNYEPHFLNDFGEIVQFRRSPPLIHTRATPLCEEPLNKLNILWDGTVTPCCHDINGSLPLGNIEQHGIDEIWHSEAVIRLHQAFMRHDLRQHPLCRECVNHE